MSSIPSIRFWVFIEGPAEPPLVTAHNLIENDKTNQLFLLDNYLKMCFYSLLVRHVFLLVPLIWNNSTELLTTHFWCGRHGYQPSSPQAFPVCEWSFSKTNLTKWKRILETFVHIVIVQVNRAGCSSCSPAIFIYLPIVIAPTYWIKSVLLIAKRLARYYVLLSLTPLPYIHIHIASIMKQNKNNTKKYVLNGQSIGSVYNSWERLYRRWSIHYGRDTLEVCAHVAKGQ